MHGQTSHRLEPSWLAKESPCAQRGWPASIANIDANKHNQLIQALGFKLQQGWTCWKTSIKRKVIHSQFCEAILNRCLGNGIKALAGVLGLTCKNEEEAHILCIHSWPEEDLQDGGIGDQVPPLFCAHESHIDGVFILCQHVPAACKSNSRCGKVCDSKVVAAQMAHSMYSNASLPLDTIPSLFQDERLVR